MNYGARDKTVMSVRRRLTENPELIARYMEGSARTPGHFGMLCMIKLYFTTQIKLETSLNFVTKDKSS
jgi:hypothetical protein